MGVAADLADVEVDVVESVVVSGSLLVQVGVHFFHLVHHVHVLGHGGLAFGFGFLDHFRIHLGEFVGLTTDGVLQVGGGVADLAGVLQMGVGVDGFGGGSGAEHLGHTGQAFLVGSLGVGEVFAVGLGFTGESSHQVFESLAHCGSPWGVYVQKSVVLIRNDSCLQKTHAFVKHFFAYFYFRPQ